MYIFFGKINRNVPHADCASIRCGVIELWKGEHFGHSVVYKGNSACEVCINMIVVDCYNKVVADW